MQFVLASVFVLEVMADFQPYCFQNVFLILRTFESENEEVNARLGGTFWCTCERCEIVPTQRECISCGEQPESENKMESRILRLYCISHSK